MVAETALAIGRRPFAGWSRTPVLLTVKICQITYGKGGILTTDVISTLPGIAPEWNGAPFAPALTGVFLPLHKRPRNGPMNSDTAAIIRLLKRRGYQVAQGKNGHYNIRDKDGHYLTNISFSPKRSHTKAWLIRQLERSGITL
jgi:predicted RNA binding protein YcfA (HicA-like mRNA interferase family)